MYELTICATFTETSEFVEFAVSFWTTSIVTIFNVTRFLRMKELSSIVIVSTVPHILEITSYFSEISILCLSFNSSMVLVTLLVERKNSSAKM